MKLITIEISLKNNDRVDIKISDTGTGILPGNQNRIFAYGFTTKKTGHGFGLHACALSIKEMGGSIQVSSPGLQQGATFTLELPYHLPKA